MVAAIVQHVHPARFTGRCHLARKLPNDIGTDRPVLAPIRTDRQKLVPQAWILVRAIERL
jgi:hypothetical protein